MESVRVGVIGTGWWMEEYHLQAIQSHPGARLQAICGRRQERALELARKFGCDRVYIDYEEMLGSSALDAVVFASPDDLHYPMTMQALEQGLHVLCEKPLARSAQQAREMNEKAEATSVKHMIMFT